MTLTIMTQGHEKSPFLTLFILLGKNSSLGFNGTPKNYAWIVRLSQYVMCCVIWYHLYSFKNVKNTHGGVLILVKLQAPVCNFTKSNTPP